MTEALVIDTNVGVVANGGLSHAGLECTSVCIETLLNARDRVVLVDDGFRIFAEYRRHLSPGGQPGAGDAFFKWLWDNQGNPRRCRSVRITPIAESETDFVEYPSDRELADFDPNDRKFIAVARASGLDPDVMEATDSKWWPLRQAFARNDVRVVFLCPELMGAGK